MTKKQKLELRRSEVRARLAEIGELEGEALTEEIRTERAGLMTEYRESETALQAAIMAEETERREIAAQDGTGAEVRALHGRARLGLFLDAAAKGRDVAGAEAELRAATMGENAETHGTNGGIIVPWAVLAGPPREARTEARADAATGLPAAGVPTMEADYLGRVFDTGAAAFLGVRMENAGMPGERTYPVITAGAAGAMRADGVLQEAEAATVAFVIAEPHRATASYVFRSEDLARSGGYEAALRDDLSMRLSELTDAQVLNGSGANGEVAGFFAGLADPADPTERFVWATYAALPAAYIDGLYARMPSDVRLLIGEETAQHMGASFPVAATASMPSALDYVGEHSGGLRACSLLPDPGASSGGEVPFAVTRGLVARTGAMGANAVLTFFGGGVETIRDPYTRAGRGEVKLTSLALFDFRILRASGYAIAEFGIAA